MPQHFHHIGHAAGAAGTQVDEAGNRFGGGEAEQALGRVGGVEVVEKRFGPVHRDFLAGQQHAYPA